MLLFVVFWFALSIIVAIIFGKMAKAGSELSCEYTNVKVVSLMDED